MHKLLRILIPLTLLSFLIGCSGKQPSPNEGEGRGTTDPVMLIDYYETTTGTTEAKEDDSAYYELVLYDDRQDMLLLVEYKKNTAEDEVETRYRVPRDVLASATNLIYDAKMETWNDLPEPEAVDGALYVVRFREDGYYQRVSSQEMPENGMDAFAALRSLLGGYLSEDRRE